MDGDEVVAKVDGTEEKPVGSTVLLNALREENRTLRAEVETLTGRCTCVWCWSEYQLGPTQAECISAMREHMEVCEKHPIHNLRVALQEIMACTCTNAAGAGMAVVHSRNAHLIAKAALRGGV